MRTIKQQYIEDSKGQKIAVILPIEEYNKMVKQIEELEDIKLYDHVKSVNDPSIPFEEYLEKRMKKDD